MTSTPPEGTTACDFTHGGVEFAGGSVHATETDPMNEGGDPEGRVVSWPVS